MRARAGLLAALALVSACRHKTSRRGGAPADAGAPVVSAPADAGARRAWSITVLGPSPVTVWSTGRVELQPTRDAPPSRVELPPSAVADLGALVTSAEAAALTSVITHREGGTTVLRLDGRELVFTEPEPVLVRRLLDAVAGVVSRASAAPVAPAGLDGAVTGP